MIHTNKLSLTILALLISISVVSQQSIGFKQPEKDFDKAMELFYLNKFGSAREQFEKFISNSVRAESNLISEAYYYRALCAKELENGDAEYLFEQFAIEHPESNKGAYTYFHLGDMQMNRKKYRQALREFKNVNERKLDKDTQLAFKFKKGYCHFMQEEYDVANGYFYDLKDIDNKYYEASNYYYAHIQYQKENYETALMGFERLANVKAFEKVVPFYIAQIHYLKGDYDAAITYALPLMEEGTQKRRADMARIVGESYFAKKDYANSITFFEKTIALSEKARREDYYHLGFAYYYQKKYDKAAEYLSMVTSANDKMAQNAYYHLADCHLKLSDKKRARVAFEAASKLNFDKDIQEDALFNTIKLNYELSYSPFNEIINSFMSFIEMFPESDKIDLAYDYLGKVFLSTKNYKQALGALEQIKIKSAGIYKAIQRVAYYHAIDLFTNLRFDEAISFFDYSLQYQSYDNQLKVKAYYWRGEAKYRQNQYAEAVKDYNSFILMPGSFETTYFAIAHYNIGYAEFKLKNYEKARSWWRKYIKMEMDKDAPTIGDAYNRIGDCYFVERNFDQAMSFYELGSSFSDGSPDYAMYQKGISLGIVKQHEDKIAELKDLINRYPNSAYVDDALFEMGNSYLAINDLDNAIRQYKTIKEKHPTSSYSKKAMLQLGLVYYNASDYNNSMAFYKRVVNEFPGTQEATESLLGIRNIYMDRGDLDGYVRYTKGLGSFAQVDEREQDSLSYVSAERYYMEGNCDVAVRNLKQYLKKHPKGMFVLNANYYMADCLYKQGNKKEALRAYQEVTNRSKNIFTEDALIRSGEINYGMENYRAALVNFQRLEKVAEIQENRIEARIGVLRSYYQLKDGDNSIEAAQTIINDPKAAGEIVREAQYIKAGAHMIKGDLQNALAEYKVLAKNTQSAEGAEAKYIVAKHYYDSGDTKRAEDEVFDFANKGTSHQYWLARSFIVLADIYQDRGENFQAKQYLQSIAENYTGDDDIMEMVNQRLAIIKQKMAVSTAAESADSLKIQQ
ncbi:Tetratricopeptide repeat-containing protein [Saccharicrinis carchari]|uniref:Tetratricopeptide repeat-containing protein n=1 Tax=Saccharicrinis carchari TaxID=1168039 RepID=A0A521B125_SACCC|nr:tetratricopeptide repeat protein [Saccharicrinis carchari]SMO40735.1 Tetratricopeptide repeat-containing protein [Saccharicrinis carchari]